MTKERFKSAEEIPGAGHGFYGEDAKWAIELMTEYLDSYRT